MRPLRPNRCAAVLLVTAACALAVAPSTASANPVCTAAGLFSGIAGKACRLATHAGKAVSAGKKLLGGHVGGAVKTILGGSGSGHSTASTAVGLAAIGAWVLGGARFALHETANVLSQTTTPQLQSTWFSSTYWRMTGIAAVLTLPFLFAAAIQALLRSDLALLARAVFLYLPVATLAVSIVAPLTMLLLSASDELASFVASAAGHAGTRFLVKGSALLGALTVISGSPFIAFLVGVLTAGAALVLWLELLMRETAIYVIVLMLPLVFAAFVWPARRVWAVRALEVLVALILSKFAIVAVLSLGGAALAGSGLRDVTGSLAGIVLLVMGTFAPWALLRLVPLAELASGAAGALRAEARTGMRSPTQAAAASADFSDSRWGNDWATRMMSGMRRQADEASGAEGSASAHSTREHLAELAGVSGSNGNGSAGASPDADSASREDSSSEPLSEDDSAGVDHLSQEAGSATNAATPPDRDNAAASPKLPWEGQDGSWEFVFGADGTNPTSRPVSTEEGPDPLPGAAPPADANPPADPNPRPDPTPPSPADDHDPRPPRQPSEDGLL